VSEVIFAGVGSSIKIHTAGAQACLYRAQLSHLKPVGVGYAMYRMTVLLLGQVGEDNYENRLIYITITIQQFLDLGGGLQTMLTFPALS